MCLIFVNQVSTDIDRTHKLLPTVLPAPTTKHINHIIIIILLRQGMYLMSTLRMIVSVIKASGRLPARAQCHGKAVMVSRGVMVLVVRTITQVMVTLYRQVRARRDQSPLDRTFQCQFAAIWCQ